MSDVDLPTIQQFLDQVMDPDASGSSGSGNDILWCGTVTAVDHANSKLTVSQATGTFSCRSTQWPLPPAGSVVWGIKEGRIRIAMGELAPGIYRNGGQLGYGLVTTESGGKCLGTWANGAGAGVAYVIANTTDVDLNIGLVSVPVRAKRLIRFKFRITGVDRIGGAYLTTTLYCAFNGGSYGPWRRSIGYRAGSGNVASEPVYDEWIMPVPANVTTMSFKLYGNTSAGSSYFYRYSGYTGQDVSWCAVDEVGSAADYFAQGGV